jgi:glycosyltransferase involved in cell wall biosynthesis
MARDNVEPSRAHRGPQTTLRIVETPVEVEAARSDASLSVSGVANPSSAGIWRYAVHLADALGDTDVAYPLGARAFGDPTHFHLGNSSRAFLRQAHTLRSPFAVTVHDVVPRTAALLPLYRRLAYPPLRKSTSATIVHSTFAANMLVREGGVPRRLEVIHLPAGRPRTVDRVAARRRLGWPEDELIVVLPGVIKGAKLIREAVAAAAGIANVRLALAGRIADRGAAREAQGRGGLVLPDPDDAAYEGAIVAADCILCLRAGSVGETNKPLLDALGAGRAVLATPTGSIPEVAGDAVHYCDGTEAGIREGLLELSDVRARIELERAAHQRGAELSWPASAALHAELFREVFDA